MDSSRKCSRCGSNGHNSRTCNGKELKLFGVKIWRVEEEEEEEKARKKNSSMENLGSSAVKQGKRGDNADGSLSDARHVHGVEKRERKRGITWSEEEHRRFLAGLKVHGKGEWRRISKEFVRTRTPTQVASHAQKYFLRQLTPSNKKRRSSLFDAPINVTEESSKMSPAKPDGTYAVAEEGNPLPRYYWASSSSATQVVDSSSPAFRPTVAEKCLRQCNQPGSKFMAGISYGVKNQAMNRSTQGMWFPPPFGPHMNADLIPLQFHADYINSGPDFLQLSLKSPVLSIPSTADSILMEATDLELTIGLPKSLESAKLSSRGSNLTGVVRVT